MMKRRFLQLVVSLTVLFSATVLAQSENKLLLIDTRSPAEYEEGHVAGAVLIPYDAIEAGIIKLSLAKDTPIYLYCAKGSRAEIARKRLEYRGYTQVTNLGGKAEAEAFLAETGRDPRPSDGRAGSKQETHQGTAP
ncbi:MAG: rhodanese-like domain-containing protein [Halioglobus sp.]